MSVKKYEHPDAEGRKVVVEATEAEAEKYTSQGWVEKADKPKAEEK